MATLDLSATTYDGVAQEYYNPTQHPTCANFREGSRALLKAWIEGKRLRMVETDTEIVEVGAGDSLLAEVLSELDSPLPSLTITDASREMLQHSKKWEELGAKRALADAEQMPFSSSSVDLLVSILGDPYNTRAFWEEAARVLKSGAQMVYTSPSYQWAKVFRKHEKGESPNIAKFTLQSGQIVDLPSLIWDSSQQIELIESVGLEVIDQTTMKLNHFSTRKVSPKLMHDGSPLPVVDGYLVLKR